MPPALSVELDHSVVKSALYYNTSKPVRQVRLPIREGWKGLSSAEEVRAPAFIEGYSLVLAKAVATSGLPDLEAYLWALSNVLMVKVLPDALTKLSYLKRPNVLFIWWECSEQHLPWARTLLGAGRGVGTLQVEAWACRGATPNQVSDGVEEEKTGENSDAQGLDLGTPGLIDAPRGESPANVSVSRQAQSRINKALYSKRACSLPTFETEARRLFVQYYASRTKSAIAWVTRQGTEV